MELARQNLRRLQVPQIAIHLQLPLYLRLMLLLLLGIMLTVAVAAAITRLMPPPSNPFAAYADILPGHPKQAALERGFTCFTNIFANSESCTRRDEPASRLFSMVHLSTFGDYIHRLSFTMSVNTLTIGDLVRLWGRPAIQPSGRIVEVRWTSPNVTALAIPSSEQSINYFTPVVYLVFIAS